MRSSNKPRSRNKNSNRRSNNNNGGNIVNRVFDSAGPDGRVRGTPQQIIEKYSALAHDALLSDDRVAAENFRQHAEHYSRLLVVAQKALELQNEQHAQRQAEQQARQAEQQARQAEQQARQAERQAQQAEQQQQKPNEVVRVDQTSDQPDVSAGFEAMIEQPTASEETRVSTPESKTENPRRAPRQRRKPVAPEPDVQQTVTPEPTTSE